MRNARWARRTLVSCSLLAALVASGATAAAASAQPHSSSSAVASSSVAARAQSSIRHLPRESHLHPRTWHSSESTNWAGYATSGNTYYDARATWVEPWTNCAATPNSYSSYWVGIDGDTTSTVEQIGTEADCSHGAARTYAWFEMYPQYPVRLSQTVHPGDHLAAEVYYKGYGAFGLTLRDTTRGWVYSTTRWLSSARRGSAECIAEAPSSSQGALPLTDFYTMTFTSCTANGTAMSGGRNADEMQMVTPTGMLKAQTTSTWGAGAFSVAWKHS